MRTCVGLDIGRSSVKVVSRSPEGRREILFPSSVCPAFAITDEREQLRALEETVTVNQRDYFFGATAALQGQDDLLAGLRDDWVFTDSHTALFRGALRKLQVSGVSGVDSALVVVGLPASLYASQKTRLLAELARYAPKIEMRVLPQSIGPYQQMLFNSDGSENPDFNADEDSWGVIEIGQYTTDYALLLEGHPIENAFGSCDGMRISAQALQRSLSEKGFMVNLSESTDILRTKKVRNYGEKVDVTADVMTSVERLGQIIVDKANQLIGKQARSLDGILVAGGGASLIMPFLQKAWPHARLMENPRFSVAEGFCRYACAFENYRANGH